MRSDTERGEEVGMGRESGPQPAKRPQDRHSQRPGLAEARDRAVRPPEAVRSVQRKPHAGKWGRGVGAGGAWRAGGLVGGDGRKKREGKS